MNFVKRAGLSLWARKARTLLTFATFLVISVMVLAGVLVDGATGRAEAAAKRSVGAEVTLDMDLDQLGAGSLQAPVIDTATVDRIGRLPQVRTYTYSMFDRLIFRDDARPVGDGPDNPMGPGGTVGIGVLDSSLLPDFRSGRFRLLSGRHLTAADEDAKRLLIEERLARANGLKAGDEVEVTGNDEKTTAVFTVTGVYRDPRPTDEPEPEYLISPANMVYGTVGGIGSLAAAPGPPQVTKATFLLHGAEEQGAFTRGAKRVAGAALDGFRLDANDKAVRQMTGPLGSIRTTATVAMWLTASAGVAVLALLVNLAVRQRRTEYGVLLGIGEKKGKLVAQQALETAAVALLAVGLGALIAPALTQSAGQSLLGREAAAAQREIDAWEPPAPGSTGIDEGASPDDRPVDGAEPVDRITVALDPADLAVVGGAGLGIALLATAIPAAAVLSLSPRTILTKGK